ncbi:unnamed protein product [Nezara viridula]|uniref:Reverse transcriptase domain-containing protein n=1 Tax=Nezara viridula TaxID=85310 RepID=A0A9P0ECT5_NEZVI|nr:unnamed protein product [Nezara viridula]
MLLGAVLAGFALALAAESAGAKPSGSEHSALPTEANNVIPNHQFGFRPAHSTIQQCHKDSKYSDYCRIGAGVPQGSILRPVLYSIYSSDISQTSDTLLSTYADDTVILSTDSNPITASQKAQIHLNLL